MEDIELTRPPTNTSSGGGSNNNSNNNRHSKVISNGINTNNIKIGLDGKPYQDTKTSDNKVSIRNKIYTTIWEGVKRTGTTSQITK